MKRLLAAAAMLLATTAASHAEDGQGLYHDCASGSPSRMFCTGYVLGATDVLAHFELFCLPSEVTAGTLADVIRLWLAQHPAERTKSGARVVMSALSEAYPCKKGVKHRMEKK